MKNIQKYIEKIYMDDDDISLCGWSFLTITITITINKTLIRNKTLTGEKNKQ